MEMFKNLFYKAAVISIFFFTLFLSGHLLHDQFTSSDDPYYHAKHALLIEQSGNLTLLKPWLEFHFFNFAPVDSWWGFHLGMALFIHFFGLYLGVKIFISFLATLVFLVFYLILNKFKIRYPLVWTLFLFFSSTIFCNRLFLERPHLLSMIALPLAFFLLVKGRNFWLFVLSLFYTLSYVLAPLIILQTLIYLVIDAYVNKRINLRPLIASAGGILVGAILHPASLNYFYNMFTQVWLVLFLRFSGVNLNIGNEVRLMGFPDFLYSNFLALSFYIIAVALFLSLRKFKENSTISNFLFLYSSLWLIVTLLVPRGVEYWLPIIFLFIAVESNDFIGSEEFRQTKHWLVSRVNLKIVGFFLASLLIVIVFNNLSYTFIYLRKTTINSLSENYRQANDWLKTNTEENSIIFYDNWGMWPMMFFYNDYNHYVIGIDVTSTHEYDKRTYWLWRNISAQGIYCDQPKPCFDISPRDQIKWVPIAIKTVFRSKYAVVSNYEDSNLIRTLNNLKNQVRLVFKNKDLLIYEMK